VAGTQGKSGTQDSRDAGDANDVTGGGAPGAVTDYLSYLQAYLQRHKEYPRSARLRRQEGTALLYFEMDRQGRVNDFRLQRSSGYSALDQEVVALLQRASPLPPPPPDLSGNPVKLVVPVQFLLR
jgi:protein TonB